MNTFKRSFLFLLTAITITGLFATKLFATAGQWSASGSMIYYNDGKLNLGSSSTSSWGKVTIETGYPEDYLSLKTPGAGLTTQFRFMSPNDQKLEIVPFDHTISQAHFGAFTMVRNGNIGINTENPQYKLAVNGTILAKELIVSTNAAYWPDYVFAQNYKLRSLNEVGSYIKENSHLPNTPSAEDLEKSGLSVGDMQIIQMEKIEELTLYLIQQEKKINDLENRLSKLESFIK